MPDDRDNLQISRWIAEIERAARKQIPHRARGGDPPDLPPPPTRHQAFSAARNAMGGVIDWNPAHCLGEGEFASFVRLAESIIKLHRAYQDLRDLNIPWLEQSLIWDRQTGDYALQGVDAIRKPKRFHVDLVERAHAVLTSIEKALDGEIDHSRGQRRFTGGSPAALYLQICSRSIMICGATAKAAQNDALYDFDQAAWEAEEMDFPSYIETAASSDGLGENRQANSPWIEAKTIVEVCQELLEILGDSDHREVSDSPACKFKTPEQADRAFRGGIEILTAPALKFGIKPTTSANKVTESEMNISDREITKSTPQTTRRGRLPTADREALKTMMMARLSDTPELVNDIPSLAKLCATSHRNIRRLLKEVNEKYQNSSRRVEGDD